MFGFPTVCTARTLPYEWPAADSPVRASDCLGDFAFRLNLIAISWRIDSNPNISDPSCCEPVWPRRPRMLSRAVCVHTARPNIASAAIRLNSPSMTLPDGLSFRLATERYEIPGLQGPRLGGHGNSLSLSRHKAEAHASMEPSNWSSWMAGFRSIILLNRSNFSLTSLNPINIDNRILFVLLFR